MLFIMFAAVIVIAWGFFHEPHIAAAAILMWGTGDAAAALIGIPFGKHKIMISPVNGRKSWEGSIGMFIVSFTAGLIILLAVAKYSLPSAIISALAGALAGTATELFSATEWDTVTVPTVILAVLLGVHAIL